MATIQITLQYPTDIIENDITQYVINAEDITIQKELENDSCSFQTGEVELVLEDTSGTFSSMWTLPLSGELRWDYTEAKGTWCVRIYKDGSLVWVGDIQPDMMTYSEKEKVWNATAVGILKRLEQYKASNCKRSFPDPLTFTSERLKRVLTFPNPISTYNFETGDIIVCDRLQQNGNLIDQKLEVKALSGGTLTPYQLKVRQGCKRAYTQGRVENPWYRGKSVQYLVSKLFEDVMGMTSSDYSILGSVLSTLIVDEAKFKDKTVAEALVDLAKYSGSIIYTRGEKFYFADRAYYGSSEKTLDSVACQFTAQPLDENYYLSVKVTGTAPYFAPNSAKRQYRLGKTYGQGKTYEYETEYTSSTTTLATIAGRLFARWAKIRTKAEIEILDDGTLYDLGMIVTYNSKTYMVRSVSEPLRSVCNITIAGNEKAIRGTIILGLLEVPGQDPSTADYEAFDVSDDIEMPYPPEVVEVSSSKRSKRKSWWTEFREVYPSNADVPNRKYEKMIIEGVNPSEDEIWVQEYILWAVRWRMPDGWGADDEDAPDAFELTAFKADKDPSKPKRHKRVPNVKAITGADGKLWYYGYFYKPVTSEPVEWLVVLRTYISGHPLSAYSDFASTLDDGGDDDDPQDISPPQILMGVNGDSLGITPALLRYNTETTEWEKLSAPLGLSLRYDGLKAIVHQRLVNRLILFVLESTSPYTSHYVYSDDFGTSWKALPVPSDLDAYMTGTLAVPKNCTAIYTINRRWIGVSRYFDLWYIDSAGTWHACNMMGFTDYVSCPLINSAGAITADPNNANNVWILALSPTRCLLFNSKYGDSGNVKYGTCDVVHGTPNSTLTWVSGDTFDASDVGKTIVIAQERFKIIGYSSGQLLVESYGDYPKDGTGVKFKIYDWKLSRFLVGAASYTVDRIFAANEAGVVFAVDNDIILKSTDYGDTWAVLYTLSGVTYIYALWQDDFDDNVIYVGAEADDGTYPIWRSTNGGSTFTQISGTVDDPNDRWRCKSLIGQKDQQNAIAGYGQNVSGTTTKRLVAFFTTDGTTWANSQPPTTFYPSSFVTGEQLFAVKGYSSFPPPTPQDQEPIYLLCRNLTSAATEKRRIYRTRDNFKSVDKIWGDATDFVDVRGHLEVDWTPNTRIYRLAEGDMAKVSDTAGVPSSEAVIGNFQWYRFYSETQKFWKVQLACNDLCAYVCNGYNIYRTRDRKASQIVWDIIHNWGNTAGQRAFAFAICQDTDELYIVRKDGKLLYCQNPYYDTPSWGSPIDTQFGDGEVVDVIATKTYIYVVGNNAGFKIRRASKVDIQGGSPTWTTIATPSGMGNIEQNGFCADYENESVALIATRNSTAGLWGCNNMGASPTWTTISTSAFRCACKMANLVSTYAVAGNGVLGKAKLEGTSWTFQNYAGSDIDNLAEKNFIAIATARQYFPSSGNI